MFCFQYIAGCVVSGLASMSIGTVFGFSAILIPQLVSEGLMTSSKSSEASWVASLSNIGQLFGSLMAGYLAGSCGRKRTIIFLCFPLIGGWTVIGISQGDFKLLCVGRVLQGVGIMSSVSQLYLVEMADAKRRGMMGGSGALSVSAGITLVYTLGACMNWRWVCLACAIHVFIIIIAMIFMPETPNWLIENSRRDEAVKALIWLRGPDHNIDEEIGDLSSKLLKSGDQGSNQGNLLRQLIKPSCFKPLILLVFLFILMQSTGTFAVIFYAVNVFQVSFFFFSHFHHPIHHFFETFQDAGVTENSYIAAIFVGFLRLVGALGGTLLLKKVPRKMLLIISGILMGLSLVGLSVDLYISDNISQEQKLGNETANLQDHNGEASGLSQGITVFCLILYMLSYGLGIGTVPWLLLGELTPPGIKGITSGVVTSLAFFTVFIVVKFFPFSVQTIGTHGTYLCFAGVCFVASFFSCTFIPETRGKTMAELMTLFETKNLPNGENEIDSEK